MKTLEQVEAELSELRDEEISAIEAAIKISEKIVEINKKIIRLIEEAIKLQSKND